MRFIFGNKYVKLFLFFALISTPVVLWVLPADYFDSGQSMCLSVLMFDMTCLGCGMTRAIQHLIHGDFNMAMEFNKLSVVLVPVLIFLWTKNVVKLYRVIFKGN